MRRIRSERLGGSSPVATVCLSLLLGLASPALGACSSGSPSPSVESPSGAEVPMPHAIEQPAIGDAPTAAGNGAVIDLGQAAERGVILASADGGGARMKLTVACGDMAYAYDLPGDGTPISVPVNMGDGEYAVRVMRNMSGNDYVEVLSAMADVRLASEFQPFLVPNVFCSYDEGSACVAQARRIAEDSSNQGELALGICEYVMGQLEYDKGKASTLENATGYVPSPDGALAEGRGICFDYASLCAALFRATGIPAKLVTGYVPPDGIYHAWVEAYVDGRWSRYGLSVEEGRWSRLDVTMADEADADAPQMDSSSYEVRYVY